MKAPTIDWEAIIEAGEYGSSAVVKALAGGRWRSKEELMTATGRGLRCIETALGKGVRDGTLERKEVRHPSTGFRVAIYRAKEPMPVGGRGRRDVRGVGSADDGVKRK